MDLSGFNIFNVGTETGNKIIDVVNLIFEIVGYKVPIDDLGEREGDVSANYASSAKLQKAVGWKANVPLKDGLAQSIEFFKHLP